MKSAPPHSHRPRSSALPLAVGASLLGGLGLSGCLVELPPLVEDGIGGSGGGFGGTPPVVGGSGGSGVPGGAGGSGGNGGSDPCGAGFKQCPGVSECVATTDAARGCGDPSCNPCVELDDTVVMGCSEDGQCQVQGCREGFADCDGDSVGRSGTALSSSNGCEYTFGAVASSSEPLLVPKRTVSVNGDRSDWNGVPVYRLDQACAGCGTSFDYDGPLLSAGTVPPPTDLDAYFRIAWDASNFYVFAEAFDDHLYTTTSTSGGKPLAANEDGILMVFDGLNDRAPGSSYENDDTRVYVGLSEQHKGFNRDLQVGQLGVVAQQNGPRCYRIEAQLAWRYIVGFDESNSQGQLPPAPGKRYGFDMSFNDWDPEPGGAEPALIQHQNQVFWLDPGNEWWIRSQGWGAIELVDDGASTSDAGAP